VSETVRIAVVGAGRMGQLHLAALEAARGVRAAAVVEPREPVRAAAAGRGLAAYDGVDALLESGGADAAIVAAPSPLHLPLVERLAGGGLDVLCEKPCGTAAADAARARDLAERAGLLLQVGFWRRFVPALGGLRERIRAGALGEISAIACWQWDELPPPRAFRETSGGIVVDMGVHELDQLRWLTGQEVERVAGLAGGVAYADPVEGDPESAALLCSLSGGTLGIVSLGRRFAGGDACWLEVVGTAGHERLDFMAGPEGERVFRRALVAQVEAFAAAVRDRAPRGAGADDARRVLLAAEQGTAALASGKPSLARAAG
jgi:myo-inositol 2-dehydrogenase/D-chiro-inositol 1-dehydrogenase